MCFEQCGAIQPERQVKIIGTGIYGMLAFCMCAAMLLQSKNDY